MERALEQALPPANQTPPRLHQAMRYAVLGGGKRVRPMLAFAAGEVADARARAPRCGLRAVEMIHAYSLVHDDLPCMDDDVLRRGKPTCHVEFDEATALLVGDALQRLAFQLLAERTLADDPAVQLDMMQHARGRVRLARHGRRPGDRPRRGRQDAHPARAREHAHPQDRRADPRRGAAGRALRERPRRGTAYERLDRYAKCVGLAFQVVDDVLDAEGEHRHPGQDRRQGAAQGKPTYVSLLGSRARASSPRELRQEAHEALERASTRARRACASSPTSSSCASSESASAAGGQSNVYDLLKTINDPADLRKLDRKQLPQLAEELRALRPRVGVQDRRAPLVEPRHGGADHRAALRVRHARRPHRLGRGPPDLRAQDPHRPARRAWRRLRMKGGISGFPRRAESAYDTFGTAHSRTSISAALGMARGGQAAGARTGMRSPSSATAR